MAVDSKLVAAEFFAGIGLVRLALDSAGIDVVWANDIEPSKHAIYAENFPDTHYRLGDVRDVTGDQLPRVDIATASFPCTDLSLAGNRGGLRSGESSMFWEFARVLSEMESRPNAVLLENVPGFATSHGGRDIRDAVVELNRLGYSCDLMAVNADAFVPQSRLRVFIVGLQHVSDRWLPLPPLSEVRPDFLRRFYVDNPELRLHARPLPQIEAASQSLESFVERLPATDPRWWDAERRDRFVASLSDTQAERLERLRTAGPVAFRTAYRRTRKGVATWEIRADDVAGCLRTARGGSSRQAIVQVGEGNVAVRWMIAREYASLQGAPREFSFASVSENKALSGFGDAVCVPVVQWLASNYLVDGASLAVSAG